MAGDVNNIAQAYTWSISKIGRAFGMDRKTVARRLDEAAVKPAGKQGGYPTYALKDVGPALYASVVTFDLEHQDPDKMPPKERKDWFQSENERLKFQEKEGQLIPHHDTRAEYVTLIKAVVNSLDTLPDLLERDCGLEPAAIERAQDVIDQLREQMYQAATADAEADPEEAEA